jgi:ribosome-associated protein
MNSTEKMAAVTRVLDSKKGGDIRVLKIGALSGLADYFVLCSGGSSTQIQTLADETERQMALLGAALYKKEGRQGLNWVLLDYSDVVVHIFHEETRAFYGLEKLWADAETVDVDAIVGANGGC